MNYNEESVESVTELIPTTISDGETETQNDIESELTNKFLRGEISFADYSIEWHEQNKKNDDLNTDHVNQNEEALASNAVLDTNTVPRRRKYTRLSPSSLRLIGEANLRFARGEAEIAEKICYEIIKKTPTASEPYQTLAYIYDHDQEKSLQFSLLAAHLSPSDAEEWLRLAQLSKIRLDVKQEMLCLTQAIKAQPESLAIHMKRLDLVKQLEDSDYPLNTLKISRVKCYHKIVESLSPMEGPTIMEYAKKAAALYHKSNEIETALEIMNIAYKKSSSLFEMEDLNLYLELLIAQKQFQTCIEVFVANAGVEMEAEVQTLSVDGQIEEQTNYLNSIIPNNLPIDLKSKLLVCLIHLNSTGLVESLLQEFLSNDVDKALDLYMDIEEALSNVGQHSLALKLLEPLIASNKFDLGAVWLKHAECLYNLGRIYESINSYYKVIQHAPQHVYARRKLFVILENQGNINEALDILQQDFTLVISAQLLHEQCIALKKYGETLKYLKAGEALLSKTIVRFRHSAELKIARLVRTGIDLIHNFRTLRGEAIYNEDDLHFDEEEQFKLSPSEEWELFNDLMTIAFEYRKYNVMQRLSFGALMSKNLNNRRVDIEYLCMKACLLSNDVKNAFPFVRDLVHRNIGKIPAYNLLNAVYFDNRNFVKFIVRLFQKEDNIIKYLFLGNSNLMSGRYLSGLKNYLHYHESEKDPLSALLISITVLVMAAQRTVDKHHNLILQGVSYLLTYQKLRKWDHESYYNFGRAFQMLNLNNLAIEYYKRALNCVAHISATSDSIDLTRETAFNLHILYKEQSPHIARMYLQQYLVI